MTKERQPLHFLFAKAICLSFLGNGGCGRPYTSAVSAGSSAQALRLEHQCPAMLVSPEAPATIRHDFRVGNPSATTPMTLTLVEQSCGCIRHILSQEATPPLGDVSISLETDLPMATGVTRRHVTFSTNLAELPRVDLSLAKRAAIPSGLHKGWIDVDLDGPDEPRLRIRVLVWGATGST